jgi:hypothetical protein
MSGPRMRADDQGVRMARGCLLMVLAGLIVWSMILGCVWWLFFSH